MSSGCDSSQTASGSASERRNPSLGLMAWGVPLRLSAETGPLLNRMRSQAPFGSVECSNPPSEARTFTMRAIAPDGYRVHAGAEVLVDGAPLDPALMQLGGHMMIHVAEHAPEHVFLHAGAVAWQNRALLLPGVSCAGKSTLVAELVRAGATYYSDEFALLDSEGRVHPFPRDLRMRCPGGMEQTPLSIAQMEGRAGTDPLPVSLVVLARFEQGAHWKPEPISPGRAVLEMLLHSIPVQRTPARVMATLSATMRHATAWRSPRGEAAPVARSLLTALAAQGPPA